MKGYMTIEASLILPMVFGVILFVISLLFYSYDRCLLEQDVTALVVRGEYLEGENIQEKVEFLEQEIQNWYVDKYIWMEVMVHALAVKENSVRIEAGGTFGGPFFQSVETQRESLVLSPKFWLRQKKKIEKQLQDWEETDENGVY